MTHVYFLRATDGTGPVKIGSAKKPEDRLAVYGHWSPRPLEILAQFPGTASHEKRLHAVFCIERSHHEWFEQSPALSRLIEAVRDGSFDPRAVQGLAIQGPGWRQGTTPNHWISAALFSRFQFAASLGFVPSAETRRAAWTVVSHAGRLQRAKLSVALAWLATTPHPADHLLSLMDRPTSTRRAAA